MPDEEVERLNALIAENPMHELPPIVHSRLVDSGYNTREQVIRAFENGDLLPGKLRNFGKKSYNIVAKWIGMVPFPGCGRNQAYLTGMERAFQILDQGGSERDLEHEIKVLRKSLAAQRKLKQAVRRHIPYPKIKP